MTTLRGIGMLMYMTMLMCLVLAKYICYTAAAEQVPRCIHPQHAAVSM